MTTDLLGVPVEAVAVGGGSVAVIGAAAALFLRGRRRSARIDSEEEALAGAATLSGFVPATAVVGHDGAAALVSGRGAADSDRLVLVVAGKARLTAREIGWGAVRATADGMVVETGDRRDAVLVVGIDALDVRRLAPAASPEAVRIAERLAPPPDLGEVAVGTER